MIARAELVRLFSIFIDFLQSLEWERWINLEQKEITQANDQLKVDLLAQ